MSDQIAAMFRRRPNEGWFQVGRFDVTTTDIVCALAVASMFVYGTGVDNFNKLVFVPALRPRPRGVAAHHLADRHRADRLVAPRHRLLLAVRPAARGPVRTRQIPRLGADVTIIPALILTALGPLDSSIRLLQAQFGLSSLFLGGIWVYAATYPGVKLVRRDPVVGDRRRVHRAQPPAVHGGRRDRPGRSSCSCRWPSSLVAGRSLGLATGWPIPHIPLDGVRHRTHKPKKAKKPKKPRSSGSSSVCAEGSDGRRRAVAHRPATDAASVRLPRRWPTRKSSIRCSTRSAPPAWTRSPRARRSV